MKKAHSDLLSFRNVTIILIATILLASWCTMNIYFMDETELYNYAAQPSTGHSKGTDVVMYMLYRYLGKIGVIFFHWSFVFFFLYAWLGVFKDRKKEQKEKDSIKVREQDQLAQLSKRKSWRKKQEQKRKNNKNS